MAVRPAANWYLAIKPICDFVVALVLLIPLFPVMIVAGLAIKLTSSGPALYVQTRVGLHGRNFRMFKLRTMSVDAEARSGPVWASGNDPRVTLIGRFLRRTHIDEFPQLFNVLRGEMSLVGPRPERPEFVGQLEQQLLHYRDRLNVKPGVTGLAQLALPPDSNLESVRRKLIHDLYYVHSVSFMLDVRITLETGWGLLRELLREARKHERGLLRAPGFVESMGGIVGPDSALLAECKESTVLA